MTRRTLALATILLGFGLAVAPLQLQAAAPAPCDRDCLKGLMDDYLAALVAHDPKRLKTTPDIKFTENTNRMALGDGLWHTAGSAGTFRLYIEDPETSQAALYGSITENGVPALLGVRLKARDRLVSELETVVVRQASTIFGDYQGMNDRIKADPAWDEIVPAAERSSREDLVRSANQYFEGIEQGNGDIVPFADDCTRIENGITTAAPGLVRPGRPPQTIAQSFSSHIFDYIHEVTGRRFPLVDPERGLVYVIAEFQHPGNIPSRISAPAGTQGPGSPPQFSLASYPNTTLIVETFKLRAGKIHRIFAYVVLMPYRQPMGW
jgi:hypothetical protein